MLLTFTHSVSVNGNLAKEIKTVVGDVAIGPDHSTDDNPLVVAKGGTLTTRTNDTGGIITLTGGHGLATGTFDIFWGSGSTGGARRGVSCTIVTNACTITGGSGDNLPAATTVVSVAPIETESVVVVGDNVKAIVISAQNNDICFAFYDDTGTPALISGAEGRVAAGSSYIWHNEMGSDNPLAGENVTQMRLSQASITEAGKMRSTILY